MSLSNRSAVSRDLSCSTAMLITPLLRMSYAYDRCLIFKDINARNISQEVGDGDSRYLMLARLARKVVPHRRLTVADGESPNGHGDSPVRRDVEGRGELMLSAPSGGLRVRL
jgi:hypothetical protein